MDGILFIHWVDPNLVPYSAVYHVGRCACCLMMTHLSEHCFKPLTSCLTPQVLRSYPWTMGLHFSFTCCPIPIIFLFKRSKIDTSWQYFHCLTWNLYELELFLEKEFFLDSNRAWLWIRLYYKRTKTSHLSSSSSINISLNPIANQSMKLTTKYGLFF